MKNSGAWIFLSHSNKDIEKVRYIRNEFEKLGHSALIFFLKCIDDHSELEDLIKREIKARNWFILCDSVNAKKSQWVQEEVKIIKNLKGIYYETISLDDDIKTQIHKITKFSRKVTVFISYTQHTESIAKKVYDKLLENDYGVFFDKMSIQIGTHWINEISSAIKASSKKGFFVLLIDKNTFNSNYIMKELKEALQLNSYVIPIFIDNPKIVVNLPIEILQRQYFDFSHGEFDDNMNILIKQLKAIDIN